jgi:uncharacterized protein YwqG
MDKAQVQTAFEQAGLTRLLKDIDYLARMSVRLTPHSVDEAQLRVGASKIGGVPDLPTGVNWPQWKGVPQSFIAQVSLDEVCQYDTDKLLPPQGVLWFFYDAKQETYGEDPADRGGWQVFYREDESNLQRTTTPATLPTESQFQACSIDFSSEITLSLQPKLDIPTFDWTGEEQQHYETFLATFPSPQDHAKVHHRLLGNPDTIQDDMRLQCQLVSHGVTDSNDPQVAELSKGAMDWRLLLQIDTDEQHGMRWASTGMLYYWITNADLQARRFDTMWLVLQSE